MPFFQKGPEKRRSGQRGSSKSGADRLQRAQARAIELALRQHPELAGEYARQSLGLGRSDPMGETLDLVERFRDVFPAVRDVDKGRGPDWSAILAPLVAALAPVLLAGRVGPAAGVALPAPQPAPQPARPTPTPAAPLAPVAALEPVAPLAPADQVAAATEGIAVPDAAVDGPLTLGSRMAIEMLAGKQPAEAAAVILRHAPLMPILPDAIAELLAVPPGELGAYLVGMQTRRPELAGLARWLALHPAWTAATVAELRTLVAAAA